MMHVMHVVGGGNVEGGAAGWMQGTEDGGLEDGKLGGRRAAASRSGRRGCLRVSESGSGGWLRDFCCTHPASRWKCKQHAPPLFMF